MKKIISIISAILLIFVAGCSAKEQSSTYVLEKNGVKIELTYYHDGDKVLRQTANNTMNYKEMGATKDQVKQALEPMAKQYQGVDGLEEKIDFQDDKAVETLSIDYTKADKSKLNNIQGITVDGVLDKETFSTLYSAVVLDWNTTKTHDVQLQKAQEVLNG